MRTSVERTSSPTGPCRRSGSTNRSPPKPAEARNIVALPIAKDRLPNKDRSTIGVAVVVSMRTKAANSNTARASGTTTPVRRKETLTGVGQRQCEERDTPRTG